MGIEWVQPTWIMGAYAGDIIDYEPMVPLSFVVGPQDQTYEESLTYVGQTITELPTKYTVDYSADTGVTTVTLGGKSAVCTTYGSVEDPVMDIATTAVSLKDTTTGLLGFNTPSGLNTFVTALDAANMVVLVAKPPNPGPLTVFAPTNSAFAALGSKLLGCLLLPENVLVLQDILSYHYTYGQVLAGELTNDQMITMANGKDITITIIPGVFLTPGIFINADVPATSAVVVTNVLATNGVIHAIDSVLLPPGLDVEGFLATSCPVPSPAPSPAPTSACVIDVTITGGCPKQSDENTGPIVVTLDTSSTDDQVKPGRLLDIFVYTRQEPIDYPQ